MPSEVLLEATNTNTILIGLEVALEPSAGSVAVGPLCLYLWVCLFQSGDLVSKAKTTSKAKYK